MYDLEIDPWEFNNLAGVLEYAGVQEQLRRQLRHRQESTGDGLLKPDILNCLTEEYDAILAEYYQEPAWGKSQSYEWHYTEYLNQC